MLAAGEFAKLRRSVKRCVELWCAAVYWCVLVLPRRRPRRLILYYHGIDEGNVDAFKRQMAYLARHCRVVRPTEVMSVPAGSGEIVVGITFDDALACVFDNAVDALRDCELTAAIFVPTGPLGRSLEWEVEEGCADYGKPIMTAEQVVHLDREGFEILSHTVSHARLGELNHERCRDELAGSKVALEALLGHEVVGVSYPHGSCDESVCQAAHQAGYEYGFTIEPRMITASTHLLRIGRFVASAREGQIEFRLKAAGAYAVVGFLRRLKKLFRNALGRMAKHFS